MKRLTIATVMVVALMFSGSALAGETSVYLGGGVSTPTGLWGDMYKMGVSGTVGMGFMMSPNMEVGARVGYTKFPLDVPVDLGGFLDLKLMSFLADIKFIIGSGNESALRPYLSGTVGITQAKLDLGVLAELVDSEEATESKPAFGFGAGFDYAFSPTAAFWLDAKYMIVALEGESLKHIPIRAGVKFMFGGTE